MKQNRYLKNFEAYELVVTAMANRTKDSPKKRIENAISRVARTGDFEELEELANENIGPRTTTWVASALIRASLQQQEQVVSQFHKLQPDPRKNIIIWFLLSQELNFKALFESPPHYLRALGSYDFETHKEFFDELKRESGQETLSFGADHFSAKKAFCLVHENYRKLERVLASMAAIVDKDPKWSKPLGQTYLAAASNGRYGTMAHSDAEVFIRNAIVHGNFTPLKDGKFKLTDRKEMKKLTGKRLDKELNSMVARTQLVFSGFLLPMAVVYAFAHQEAKHEMKKIGTIRRNEPK